jgi:thioredoxin-related protein
VRTDIGCGLVRIVLVTLTCVTFPVAVTAADVDAAHSAEAAADEPTTSKTAVFPDQSPPASSQSAQEIDSAEVAVTPETAPAMPLWTPNLRAACKRAQLEKQTLVMFVTMDGCVHCQRMKIQTLNNKDVLAQLKDKFVTASVNATKQPEIARKLNVQAFPTTLIVDAQGNLLDSIRGYQTPIQFQHRLAASTQQTRR